MKLADLLIDDWIAIPLEAADLREALQRLLVRLPGTRPEDARKLARELTSGPAGHIVRVGEDVVLVAGRVEALEGLSVILGIAAQPFQVAGGKSPERARALLVVLTPRGIPALEPEVIPALARVLRDTEVCRKLLGAESPIEVRALKELMETDVRERHHVADAVTPVRYRIYPDTPLLEVVDLMVRRGLRSVPVVGDAYQVLGMISVGDALKHVLSRGRAEAEADVAQATETLTARDVMSRSVLCVSEEQPLIEAATMMLNRDVDEVPVVRAGELVGFLTRDAILRLLFTSHAAVQP
jgi:CBS domain-containing protein